MGEIKGEDPHRVDWHGILQQEGAAGARRQQDWLGDGSSYVAKRANRGSMGRRWFDVRLGRTERRLKQGKQQAWSEAEHE